MNRDVNILVEDASKEVLSHASIPDDSLVARLTLTTPSILSVNREMFGYVRVGLLPKTTKRVVRMRMVDFVREVRLHGDVSRKRCGWFDRIIARPCGADVLPGTDWCVAHHDYVPKKPRLTVDEDFITDFEENEDFTEGRSSTRAPGARPHGRVFGGRHESVHTLQASCTGAGGSGESLERDVGGSGKSLQHSGRVVTEHVDPGSPAPSKKQRRCRTRHRCDECIEADD